MSETLVSEKSKDAPVLREKNPEPTETHLPVCGFRAFSLNGPEGLQRLDNSLWKSMAQPERGHTGGIKGTCRYGNVPRHVTVGLRSENSREAVSSDRSAPQGLRRDRGRPARAGLLQGEHSVGTALCPTPGTPRHTDCPCRPARPTGTGTPGQLCHVAARSLSTCCPPTLKARS